VDDDDLLARVQQRGRLHGRNESRRAVCAVVEALGEFLPARAFQLIAGQLPDEVRRRLSRPATTAAPTCRAFVTGVGRRLHVDGPDAAFTARVVLEQLNATRRVITPAGFAHLVAPDLRPLLRARPAPQPVTDQLPPPRRVIRVSTVPARPAPAAARPAPAPAASLAPAPVARPAPASAARPGTASAARPGTADRVSA
jgi:hypothetical protein